MQLSIIVPVYNAERYLKASVNSILSQTFSDFELILVDDGSADKSGFICNELAGSDNRIRVLHKENSGVSDARNAGLDAAVGDYIGWVDSDDIIEPDMFEKLMHTALTENADIVQCEHDRVDKIADEHKAFTYRKISSRELIDTQYTLSSGRKTNFLALWSKVFRRELFAGLRFPSGRTHEDHALMCRIVMNAKSIFVSEQVLYHYIKRDGSIITGFSPKKYRDIAAALYDNMIYLKPYDENLYKKAVNSYRQCLFRHSAYFYNTFKHEKEHCYYWTLIRKQRSIINYGANKYEKIYFFLISVGAFRGIITKNDFEPIQRVIATLRGEK